LEFDPQLFFDELKKKKLFLCLKDEPNFKLGEKVTFATLSVSAKSNFPINYEWRSRCGAQQKRDEK
jgi:hypothetical protein